jgi:hypothetical protein
MCSSHGAPLGAIFLAFVVQVACDHDSQHAGYKSGDINQWGRTAQQQEAWLFMQWSIENAKKSPGWMHENVMPNEVTKYWIWNTAAYWEKRFGWCYNGTAMPRGIAPDCTHSIAAECCVKCTCERNRLAEYGEPAYSAATTMISGHTRQSAAPIPQWQSSLKFTAVDIVRWKLLPVAPGVVFHRTLPTTLAPTPAAGASPIDGSPLLQPPAPLDTTAAVVRAAPAMVGDAGDPGSQVCCNWGGGVASPWVALDFSKQPVVRVRVKNCNRVWTQVGGCGTVVRCCVSPRAPLSRALCVVMCHARSVSQCEMPCPYVHNDNGTRPRT